MRINISKLYHYIFSDSANIEQHDKQKKDIAEFFFGEQENKEVKPTLTKENGPLIEERHRYQFRVALRSLNAKALETILYSNATDSLISQKEVEYERLFGLEPHKPHYAFPTDAQIADQFQQLDSDNHFFVEENMAAAEKAFIQYFKIAKIINDFINENYEGSNKAAYDYAYKLTIVFYQDPFNVLKPFDDYLEKFIHSNQPLRDALNRSLPSNFQQGELDLAGWQKLIVNFGPSAFQLFNNAISIQNQMASGKAPETLTQAQEAADKKQFALKFLYPELAELCVQNGLDEKKFNSCLNIRYPGFNKVKEKLSPEQRLQQAKQTELKARDNLPDIMIEGNSLGFSDYHLVKLPKDDPRAYLLGKITGCEQSIGSKQEKITINGITSENHAFYVLLKQKKSTDASIESKSAPSPFMDETTGKKINYALFDIVGQGSAWRSQTGNIVFNSWENKTPAQDDAIIVPLLQKFSEIVTREPGTPMRVNIGVRGKTPKILAKAKQCPISENALTGEYSGAQTMIYCNEERRKPLIAELAAILDNLFADKKIEISSRQKKVTLYKWICNGYYEDYFKAMKALLLSSSIDLARVLHKMAETDNGEQRFQINYSSTNSLETLKTIIDEMTVFKRENLNVTDEIMNFIFNKINYRFNRIEPFAAPLCQALKRLEEAKLDQDPDIRTWILRERFNADENTANYIISHFKVLQNAGLSNNSEVRKIFFDCWGNMHFKVNNLISDYFSLQQAGIKLDETIGIHSVVSHHHQYTYDNTLVPRIIATVIKLKDKGMYQDIDVCKKAINAIHHQHEDNIIKAFELLRAAKLEKQSDVKQAVLRSSEFRIVDFCSEVISALTLLQKHKLDRIPLIRDAVIDSQFDTLQHTKNVISAVEKLKVAKLDSNPAIIEAIVQHSFISYSLSKAELIIAAFSHLEEEKLSSDPWLRRIILNWYCRNKTDIENVKVLVATVKRLKVLKLDQDEGIRNVLSNYSKDADKTVDAVLTAYKKLDEAKIPIDNEVRKAIALARVKAEKYADNIVVTFKKLQEQKLDGDSAVCKTAFLACSSSLKTAKKVIKAVSLCQEAKLPFSSDVRATLLKNPPIALLQARLFSKTIPNTSIVQEPEEADLIARYQAAQLDLDKYIETQTLLYNKAKEQKEFDVSASDALREATTLKETLAVGGNIYAIKDKYRHEFRDLGAGELYNRFKNILAAPENRLVFKR